MKYEAWEKLAHRYNDQWVQKYSLRPTRREVKKLVLPLLEKNNDLKILDIGCGTGQLISEISEQFPFVDYLGIDVAKNMIGVAKENNSGERIRFLPSLYVRLFLRSASEKAAAEEESVSSASLPAGSVRAAFTGV